MLKAFRDAAVRETIGLNAGFTAIIALFLSMALDLPSIAGHVLTPGDTMVIGQVLLLCAIVCAALHRNVINDMDWRLWMCSIGFTWTGILFVATGAISEAPGPMVLLDTTLALVALFATTTLRVMRPRSMMWNRLQETRIIRGRVAARKNQLALDF